MKELQIRDTVITIDENEVKKMDQMDLKFEMLTI